MFMLFISKQTLAALFVGVFILMISGCESNIPTQSVDDSATLNESIENFGNLTDEISTRKPGLVDSDKLTDLIREIIKATGRDPDKLRFGELSEKGYSLKGEEAWEKYMKNWDPKEGFGEKKQLVIDPEPIISSASVIPPTPAQTGFIISEISNPPANGSVTVQYLGEQVTTNYTSTWNAYAVANTISSNINNDSNIQLTATVNGTSVIVTEKRDGCERNGNNVYVSHTNGTHITVNNDTFLMAGGTSEEGCQEEVPLQPENPDDEPTGIWVSWGSIVDTPFGLDYGWVHMWSFTWATEPLYYLDVIGVSERDYIVINSGQDGGYNKASAIVGTSEYKDPLDDTSFWWQGGDHVFATNPNYGLQIFSRDWEYF